MDHFGVCFQVIILMTSSELLGARGPELPGDEKNVITMSDEKRLIKKLLDDYETVGVVGRPVYNTSQTISVSYGLSLIQILDLDEKNQVLTTNVWSKYAWVDLLLRWKPEDYGSINLVRVPSSKIWTPDIVLYNYADTRLKEHRDALVLVESTGEVRWLPQAIFKSTCNIDITNFPFDVQKCSMKFGSWTYDGFKLDVNFLDQKDQFDISDYVRSNEWELLEYPAVKHTIYYYGLDEPYPDLTFYVVIKRVAVFYNYILVLPCVLLSFLTLVIFWLPPESPAKVMIGMSVFVAFFVLLLLLADSTPPAASSIPLIGAYFCANMILITLSTFLAVIIIQNHVRGDRKNKVPNWLKRIAIDGMARVLCMSEFLDKDAQKTTQQRSNSKSHSKDEQVQGRTAYHHQPQSTGTLRPSEGRRSMFKPSSGEEGSAGMIRGTCQVSIFPQQSTGDQPPFIHPQHFQQQQQQQQQLSYYQQQHQPTLETSNPVYMVGCSPALENDVKEIRKMLKAYITRLENKDASAKHAKEWRLVARVLDRIFFYAYIGTIIVSLCTIFPREMPDFQRIANSTVGPTTESPVTSHL